MAGIGLFKPARRGPQDRTSDDPVVIEYRPAAFASVDAAVQEALGDGGRVTLDLDPVQDLDFEGVRGLIKLLRRGREVGGEVALRTGKRQHWETLELTALDRLFPIEAKAA